MKDIVTSSIIRKSISFLALLLLTSFSVAIPRFFFHFCQMERVFEQEEQASSAPPSTERDDASSLSSIISQQQQQQQQQQHFFVFVVIPLRGIQVHAYSYSEFGTQPRMISLKKGFLFLLKLLSQLDRE